MKPTTDLSAVVYGRVINVRELGNIIRAFRKSHGLTLEKVSGMTNISMRFLSELERGKETAELGKALATLNRLGLELIVQPRGTNQLTSLTIKHNKKEQNNER